MKRAPFFYKTRSSNFFNDKPYDSWDEIIEKNKRIAKMKRQPKKVLNPSAHCPWSIKGGIMMPEDPFKYIK